MKGPRVFALCVAVSVLASVDIGSAIQESGRPNGEAPPARALDAFPESLEVELFLPRAVRRDDMDYLAWISGGDTLEQDVVRAWGALVVDLDPAWIKTEFDALRPLAQEFAQSLRNRGAFRAHAERLEELMRARDAGAARLFEQERELLRTMLRSANIDDATQEAVVERVIAARVADAVEIPAPASPHLGPSMVRLLHAFSADARLDEEARAVLRQIALDQAQALFEQRRIVVEAMLRTGYRGYEAMAKAQEEGRSLAGAMSTAFRPVAIGSSRIAASNREVLAIVRDLLPSEVAAELDKAFLTQTYGPLAEDVFRTDSVESMFLERLREEDRDMLAVRSRDAERRRAEARDRLLRIFDAEHRRYLERGLLLDGVGRERMEQALAGAFSAAEDASRGVLLDLAAIGERTAAWPAEEFAAALRTWERTVGARRAAIRDSGIVSPLVASTSSVWGVAAIGSSRDRASRMLRAELRRSGQVHRAKTSAAA